MTERALTPEERALLDEARRDPRRRLGPLVVLRELGRGGMGQVLLAWDERRGDLVAVKTLLEHVTGSARERLEREARLLAGLDHPGIARLHEAVLEGPGAPYLVMEFVRGRPLEDLVDEDRPVEPRRAAALVAEVARAVAAAHARGVVHRDLKPQNVLLRDDGRPVVLDFGLARRAAGGTVDLTRTGSVVGTLAYLAPEQIGRAREADARADVYALGGVLYALLTGRVPFDGPAAVVLARVLSAPPPPPSEHAPGLDPALERLVLACLAKRPEDRPQDAEEVARALDAWLGGASGPPPRRRAWIVALGAAATVVVLAAAALALRRPVDPAVVDPVIVDPVIVDPAVDAPTAPAEDVAEQVARLLRHARLLSDEHPADAEALCTRALALAPDTVDALANRGYVRFRLGDHAGAAADYARAVELSPDEGPLHANLGINLVRLGEREAGLAALTRGVELDPRNLTARLERAAVLVDLDRPTEAVPDLEEAARLAPRDPTPHSRLGYARYRLGAYAAAAEAYQRAAALSPDDGLPRINAAFNLVRAGRAAEALRAAEEGVALAPGRSEAWRARAAARRELGDLRGAAEDLERALALDPACELAKGALAAVRAAGGAAPAPAVVSGAEARAEARRLAARVKGLGAQDPQADALLARAFEIAPDLADVWAARGFLRYRRGEHAAAAADFAEAARLAPDVPLHHYNLGINLDRSGDSARALRAFERVLALDPDDQEAHLHRGEALLRLGRAEEAAAALTEALRRWPGDESCLAALGRARYTLGQHADAVEAFTRARALNPAEPMHLVNRAVNLLEVGRLDEALADCDRALVMSPALPSALRARGQVRLRAGAVAAAVVDLERAVELRPSDGFARRLLDEARARLAGR